MKRRKFIARTLQTSAGIAIGSTFACTSAASSKGFNQKKLGIALVGLGGYATGQLGPALKETQFCELRGIVTGTPEKEVTWAEKYGIPEKNIYNYKNFDEIADNKDIDIIYVVLPNSMHAEFTIRAAQAGKHVICEKPMATSYEDCVKMIDACKKAGKKLSIGYRLHFEPHTLESMRLGQQEVFGKVTDMDSGFAFGLRDKSKWRLDKEMAGGGPLMDVGIYTIQSTIYTLGQLPIALKATDTTIDPDFYGDVEGSLEAEFRFDSKVKSRIKTSYEAQYSYAKAEAENGSWQIEPAHFYGGIKGKTHEGPMKFKSVNQQALQMDDFAKCVLEDRQSVVPGEMGARDVFLLYKIYESMSLGKEVSLEGLPQILHKI